MGTNRVNYTARAFKQDASNAMKGDIVRGLIELITNCDDSYGDDPRGKIRIEVEHRKSAPWKVVVRDRARGMRKARMERAVGDIGLRTSGFESGQPVRGNLGRGAKDLAAFGPVQFESISDGYYSCMTLEPDGSFNKPVERRARDEDRAALGIPRGSGTVWRPPVPAVCGEYRAARWTWSACILSDLGCPTRSVMSTGAGAEPRHIPQHLAAYVLPLTASAIVFLSQCAERT